MQDIFLLVSWNINQQSQSNNFIVQTMKEIDKKYFFIKKWTSNSRRSNSSEMQTLLIITLLQTSIWSATTFFHVQKIIQSINNRMMKCHNSKNQALISIVGSQLCYLKTLIHAILHKNHTIVCGSPSYEATSTIEIKISLKR